MNVTIKTDKLKEMVMRASKGASCNKLIPLTSLLGIELKNGTLTLITTDATNYLYIREQGVGGVDFNVSVPVDVFVKLVARTTSENITLIVDSNALIVRGNGSYKIELPMDEDTGEVIKFPNPLERVVFNSEDTREINLSTIKVILNSLKPALAVTLEEPCYTGYYVGSAVLATDTYKIACMDVDSLFGDDVLISSELMDLFNVMSSEKISVDRSDNIIGFGSPDCTIYGNVMEGLDDFAVDAICGLVDTHFDSMCKIPKNALLQVLDRLSLFVNTYDKNGIYLTFTNEGLQIKSKSSSGVETIPYFESVGFKAFSCCIDIEMLMSQLKAQSVDMVELHYGLDNAIKMIDGNITHVVALLDDDRLAEE